MATIVEFALKEEPLDVEKMRKCLLKQVMPDHCWFYLLKSRILTFVYSIPYKCCVCGGSWRGRRWDLKESRRCWSWHPKASSCHLSSMQCFVGGRGSYQKEPALGNSKTLDATKETKTRWCVWYQKLAFNILIPHFREPLFDCLKDVDLIPPFNRLLLEVTFGKLYSWAVHNIRDILLEASARFKELGKLLVHMFLSVWYQQKCHTHLLICCPTVFEPGVQPVPLQTITNENPAGPSLGTIPQARFLLSMIHMLSLKHGSNSLSLLLNSGILALTQSVLRLIGEFCPLFFRELHLKTFIKASFHFSLLFFPFQAPVLIAPKRILAYVD